MFVCVHLSSTNFPRRLIGRNRYGPSRCWIGGCTWIHVAMTGGAIGIITALLAFYTAACGLCDGTTSIFRLPPGDLTRKD